MYIFIVYYLTTIFLLKTETKTVKIHKVTLAELHLLKKLAFSVTILYVSKVFD